MRDLVGQQVGNYNVTALLGEGGMGAVFEAEHAIMGRKVAIKVLRTGLASDPKLVARFMNEARAANAIRHPNIVDVLDVGTRPDGLPYLIMELLEGESLGARIKRLGRLPLVEAVAIATQAAGALAVAHEAGIVHRDLKPDNLFLTPAPTAPERQRLKLLDFGIAKLRAELSGGSVKTNTGAVMGTPPYMSPEQCMGRSGEIDHRTDIYALGIILFEMLCGAPPFTGEGFGEVLVMHMTKAPPAPSSLNPAVSPDLEATILKALAKRREDRFASMVEFRHALFVPAAPVSAGTAVLGATAPRPEAAPQSTPGFTSVLPVSPHNTTLSSASAELPARTSRRGRWLVVVGGLGAATLAAALTVRRRDQAAPAVDGIRAPAGAVDASPHVVASGAPDARPSDVSAEAPLAPAQPQSGATATAAPGHEKRRRRAAAREPERPARERPTTPPATGGAPAPGASPAPPSKEPPTPIKF